MDSVQNIREAFGTLLQKQAFTPVGREASMTGLIGNTTLEIMGATFYADKPHIFGEVNWDYVAREEQWYNSQSLNINDIPGGPPVIWKTIADKDGFINSNYGAVLYSDWNFNQYDNVRNELSRNLSSRRATAIYNRPSMWVDYTHNGRSDFMCTNAVGYLVRDGRLHAHVQMRSNDAWAGFRNDRAWQAHVQDKLAKDLGVGVGDIIWSVTSLHVYAAQYYLVDHFNKTGETHITKKEYAEKYPDSPYLPSVSK